MEKTHQCTPAELEQVMEQYGKMVYRLGYSQTRSCSDADDLYQEVFLRYYQKRPNFASEEHRRAWLLRVTVNAARTLLTSAWMRHTVPLEDHVPFQEPEEQDLGEALQALKPKDRLLLHLFYYEQCSVREIAEFLHRKESTVRTQLTRARRQLAQIMKGEDYVSEKLLSNE